MKSNILLEDGTIIEAYTPYPFKKSLGEIVFNTGMTGYQEIITDPSYAGQMVVMTYPLIGNYGIIDDDNESDGIKVKALLVKEADNYLIEYFRINNVPLIYGFDTRMVTKKIRKQGAMKCLLTCDDITDEDIEGLKTFSFPSDIVSSVSVTKEHYINGTGKKIGLIDFGYKKGILNQLLYNNCDVTIFPYNVTPEEVIEKNIDALLLSNGPGDPKDVVTGINTCQKLLGKLPMWGICLGHQIISLALGADTYKLKFGHRGSNHPVINMITGKVFMTSQNHGYAVCQESLPEKVQISYKNVNDGTIEGIIVKDYNIQTVQFHPEEGPGPEDAHFIIRDWISSLEGGR